MTDIKTMIAKAFQDGAVFGRSNQTGIVDAAQKYAGGCYRTHNGRAKPGKATYCDDGCTAERCSDTHNHREVMIDLF